MSKKLENKAKTYQIAFFALNNSATNIYLLLLTLSAYYTFGVAGLITTVILNIATIMRLFDGFTDPLIGTIIDKTMTKFGKYRPFIIVGQIIMSISVICLYTLVSKIEYKVVAYIVFILFYAIYVVGYTCQTAVTKAAQTILTSDPKQRPLFSLFDTIYTTILFSGFNILVPNVTKYVGGTQSNQEFFNIFMIIFIPISIILSILAIIGIKDKDNNTWIIENKNKISFKDFIPVLKKNKAMQMLVIAASTDKLANQISGNTLVVTALFASILGNYMLSSTLAIPQTIITILAVFLATSLARKQGQKKALVLWSFIGIVGMLLFLIVMLFINPKGVKIDGFNFKFIIFITSYFISRLGVSVTNGIVIPMIADCSDYETYKTGKSVPGLMGTLFSFVDKLASSLATSIISLFMVLFSINTITAQTTYSDKLFYLVLICFIIIPILGFICSLIAMKYYPLSKDKMKEVQEKLVVIRNKQQGDN